MAKTREELVAYVKRWQKTHPEAFKRMQLRYRSRNRERILAHANAKNAAKRAALFAAIPPEERLRREEEKLRLKKEKAERRAEQRRVRARSPVGRAQLQKFRQSPKYKEWLARTKRKRLKQSQLWILANPEKRRRSLWKSAYGNDPRLLGLLEDAYEIRVSLRNGYIPAKPPLDS